MGNPSQDYIDYICALYNSSYDDRIENTAPPTAGDERREPGEDWLPGVPASHKSLAAFQRELKEQGIKLSTSKIKKILVTGGLWTTQQTRAIQELFYLYTRPSVPHSVGASEDEKSEAENGGKGLTEAEAIRLIAKELEISVVAVSVSLPYSTVVYNLPEPSANAKRCRRWKERQAAAATSTDTTAASTDSTLGDEKNVDDHGEVDGKQTSVEALQKCGVEDDENWRVGLWKAVVAFEGVVFTTSGRGARPGISFSYSVSRPGGAGGRHYDGMSVEGYGNELWVTTNPNSPDAQKLKKSISRSTVELGYQRAREMHGVVKGPKALGLPGAGSYIYPMLVRFGVIKKQGEA